MVSILATGEVGRVEELPVVRVVGDYDAFYRDEYRSVLGLAIVLSGDRSAAEDITQEAFAAAYRDWNRIGALDQPGSWVRRVVSNKSVSRWRHLRSEAKALVRLKPDAARSIAPPDADAQAIWDEVRKLPKRQAQVIALTYLHDLTRAEVAAILECGEETVKTHLDRARQTLANRLGSGSDA